jgi:carboxylesterase
MTPHTERKRILSDARVAVLFLHGIIGSPHHFEKFYDIIPENISYHAVLLEGHGGSVKEFGKAKMKNWKKQVNDALEGLRQTHDKIIIVGHSMGTLFAIRETIKKPDKIAGLILMDSPMKAYLHPIMIKYSCQFLLKLTSKSDPRSIAATDVIAVSSDILLWRYLTWIPRFLELFSEIRATRPLISKISCKTVFYQSKYDEPWHTLF